jgi:uncharacterized membrane protein
MHRSAYYDDWMPRRSLDSTDRAVALVAYVLHLVGAVAGLTSIVGVVLNYLKRNQGGRILDSHHRWMIRTFWWALFWMIVGFITSIILIGWLIIGLTWLWFVYRQVRGILALINGEALPG